MGTTVTMYFPVVNPPSATTPQPGSEETTSLQPGNNETILLVDDEAAIRQMVAEFLAETGYRVIESLDSVSALKQAEKTGPVDLLLTDIGLPGAMNGIALAQEMRARHPRLKVLFITGFAAGERLVTADAHTRILTKPFSLNELGQRVSSLIQTGNDGVDGPC